MRALLVACILSNGCAQESPSKESEPRTMVPVPSGETRAAAAGWLNDRDWMAQHDDCVALAEAPAHDVVLLGDSITQSFGGEGRRTAQPARDVLDSTFGTRRVANMGISGDRTQHLLWRLENGALRGPAPKAYVLAIGTNNIGQDEPEQIAAGIEKILELLQAQRPESVVLLSPILPRGFDPKEAQRTDSVAVNERIRRMADGKAVHWIECEALFLEETGALQGALYGNDGLHLASPGYVVWGGAIAAALEGSSAAHPDLDRLE